MTNPYVSLNTDPAMKFDLELAVKHPDRIRHRNSNQIRIQKVVPVPDMGVVLMQDQCSNTRLHRYTDLDLYLYLTEELVPWEPAEIPLDHWLRAKGDYRAPALRVTRVRNGEVVVGGGGGASYSPAGLLQQFEHATNPFTGPWLPCGKEVQNATV